MSSSNSPCAACKFLRRKCTQECVFAPNFPPDQPQKFANVHRVFGASNVSKLLNELTAAQREHAVNSLAYEAEARLKDPVYGCVALISILQQKLKQVQTDLVNAKRELATYTSGPSSAQMFGGGVVDVVAQHQQQLQLIEEQQQMLQFNGGFDSSSPNYLYSQFQVQQQHQQNVESLGQLMLLQQPESATPQQQQQHEVAFAIPLEQQRQQQQQQQQQHEVAFAIPLDQQRRQQQQQLISNRLEIEQWRLQDDHNEEGGAA